MCVCRVGTWPGWAPVRVAWGGARPPPRGDLQVVPRISRRDLRLLPFLPQPAKSETAPGLGAASEQAGSSPVTGNGAFEVHPSSLWCLAWDSGLAGARRDALVTARCVLTDHVLAPQGEKGLRGNSWVSGWDRGPSGGPVLSTRSGRHPQAPRSCEGCRVQGRGRELPAGPGAGKFLPQSFLRASWVLGAARLRGSSCRGSGFIT